MGNNSAIPEIRTPLTATICISENSIAKKDNFENRWQCFISSLDVSEEKILSIEQLPYQKKVDLLLNFESTTEKYSAVHSVNSLKALKIINISNSKRKQDHEEFRKLFSSIEISLRTNKIDWVIEFLQNGGLEEIITFMGLALKFLSKSDTFRSHLFDSTYQKLLFTDKNNEENLRLTNSFDDHKDCNSPKIKHAREHTDRDKLTMPYTPNFSLSRNKSSSPSLKNQNNSISINMTTDTLKNCIHICLKCFKTILNNQSGSAKAFENPEVVEIITFCLLHPNYSTKALSLDLLSAICLIEEGHSRVLKAFDYFRRTIGENSCFETMMKDFRVHESLPLDEYVLEYSLACIQFINIVVHSPENINLRVYLQYSFYLLGLEKFLKSLQLRAGEKLNRHVDAYMQNLVNCCLLLDDAEAKEAAIEESARLEAALQTSELNAKQAVASFKERDLALSELVESLRSKIRDVNVATGIQETSSKRIQELEFSLAAAHRQIQRLQHSLETVQSNNKSYVARKNSVSNMTTSTTLPLGFEFSNSKVGIISKSNDDIDNYPCNLDDEALVKCSSSDSLSEKPDSFEMRSQTAVPFISTNYDTFSMKRGPKNRQLKQRPLSEIRFPHISNIESASKLYELVCSDLSKLSINFSKMPSFPFTCPLVGLPDWYRPSTSCSDFGVKCKISETFDLFYPQLKNPNATDITSSVTTDPWLNCLTTAASFYKLPMNICTRASFDENAILSWLIQAELVDEKLIKHCKDDAMDNNSTIHASLKNISFVQFLKSFNLNPFHASRLLSLAETFMLSDLNEKRNCLAVLFEKAEQLVTEDTSFDSKSILDTIDIDENKPQHSFLQILLRVQLLPFTFTSSVNIIVEQLSTLTEFCNSVILSKKLSTVLRITENLVSTLLAKPDVQSIQLTHLSSLSEWTLPPKDLTVRKPSFDNVCNQSNGDDSPSLSKSLRPKLFMEALIKTVDSYSSNLLDWTSEIVQLKPASTIFLSDIRDRISDLEYELSLKKALLSDKSVWGLLTFLPTDAEQKVDELKHVLKNMETIVGAAAFKLNSSFGCGHTPQCTNILGTISDREFCRQLTSLLRFSSAFKKCVIDLEKKRKALLKASSSRNSSQHRNGHKKTNHISVSKCEPPGDKKRSGGRHINTNGIMDNILAGIESQPLYADIHKPQSKPTT